MVLSQQSNELGFCIIAVLNVFFRYATAAAVAETLRTLAVHVAMVEETIPLHIALARAFVITI